MTDFITTNYGLWPGLFFTFGAQDYKDFFSSR